MYFLLTKIRTEEPCIQPTSLDQYTKIRTQFLKPPFLSTEVDEDDGEEDLVEVFTKRIVDEGTLCFHADEKYTTIYLDNPLINNKFLTVDSFMEGDFHNGTQVLEYEESPRLTTLSGKTKKGKYEIRIDHFFQFPESWNTPTPLSFFLKK
jgi:hypothetical protein